MRRRTTLSCGLSALLLAAASSWSQEPAPTIRLTPEKQPIQSVLAKPPLLIKLLGSKNPHSKSFPANPLRTTWVTPESLGLRRIEDPHTVPYKPRFNFSTSTTAQTTTTMQQSTSAESASAVSPMATSPQHAAISRPDYDGDGKTDISYLNMAAGIWTVSPSSNPASPYQVSGFPPDVIPTMGDFDGDGKTDLAWFQPSSGIWTVSPSSNPGAWYAVSGFPPDIVPTMGDFDGDGKTDLAWFQPSSGTWTVSPSSNAGAWFAVSGFPPDITPTPGDYDGDGKTDLAWFEASGGTWTVSPMGNPGGYYTVSGFPPDTLPTPGDFDGDGKCDFAWFRSSWGTWEVSPSSNPGGYFVVSNFYSYTVPLPGDYDDDGKTDMAWFQTQTNEWYVSPSSNPGGWYALSGFDSGLLFPNSLAADARLGGSVLISGQVTRGGTGLGGVNIAFDVPYLPTQSVSTDASGSYSLLLPIGRSYTVTPSLSNDLFAPASAYFSDLRSNQIANFSMTGTGLGAGGSPSTPVTEYIYFDSRIAAIEHPRN